MQSNLEHRLALAYAVIGGTGWLAIAIRQWLIRVRYSQAADRFYAERNGESARLALGIAGARASEVIIATLLMLVFVVAAVALYRRTWNGWDWATVVTGLATVASLIFLCAAGRVIYAAPFSLGPLWVLLYRPGVKRACGVGDADREDATAATPATNSEMIDLKQEQEMLTGLRQSLRVFEVERGLETDIFVSRYTRGLEEENADNEEWFALARLARRAEERIASLSGGQSSQG
jgi:hypothetical protein